MTTIGMITEYNPFHSGHRYHIHEVRRRFGENTKIVCVMSGNWVQRGDAALTDKWIRAGAALRGGADLVLELPTLWAVSSAETFARGGVSLLNATGIVDILSFGSEAGELPPLTAAADCLASEEYRSNLRRALERGFSYATARQEAVSALLGSGADCLKTPNNNLGVEYLRALQELDSPIQPSTLLRQGASHDSQLSADSEFASASYLRDRLLNGDHASPSPYLTQEDQSLLYAAGPASLSFCVRGVLAKLRTMSPEEFSLLPDSGEGLNHRLYEAVRNARNLEELYALAKTRRYAHARIRRLVLWAFLGLQESDRSGLPPYLRVLGMNGQGRTLLRQMKKTSLLPILTKPAHAKKLNPEARRIFELEARCTGLYDLCRQDFETIPGKSEFTENPVIL